MVVHSHVLNTIDESPQQRTVQELKAKYMQSIEDMRSLIKDEHSRKMVRGICEYAFNIYKIVKGTYASDEEYENILNGLRPIAKSYVELNKNMVRHRLANT